jgi:hypothetical protein
MGRKANPHQTAIDTPALNEAAFERLGSNANELVLVQAQHESAVRAVALQVGYQLPADCTDPDLIQRDISANMRRSVEACLEVGRGLAVLKTACAYGNFMARLDVLGIDARVAQKFMQSAKRFTNTPLTAHLTRAIGNQTKLFEMLVLDDDQLEELELTGQTGELRLDEIATMSVKELRTALREARAEGEANQSILDKKNSTIDRLEREKKRINNLSQDQQWLVLQKEATAIMNDALGAIRGGVRQALIALKNHGDEDHSVFMAGLVGQITADLAALREEFSLPDVSSAADQELLAESANWYQPKAGAATPAY